MQKINESTLEQACMGWFNQIGYKTLFGPKVLPETDNPLRIDVKEVVLKNTLQNSLIKINPQTNIKIIDEAIEEILKPASVSLISKNQEIHEKYVKGVKVLHKDKNGKDSATVVKIFDFDNPQNNDFLAINQFSVKGAVNNRRPDIVVFINGLPLIVFELKNPADESVGITECFNQIQTYKNDIEDLFVYNLACVLADSNAKIGSLTANIERFMPWRTITGLKDDGKGKHQEEVLIKGFFNKEFILDYLRYFVVFSDEKEGIAKKIAGYHQFHAVRKAQDKTLEAIRKKDSRCGVIWHTQGAGKSLSMLYLADKLMKNSECKNPTIIVITDRDQLDDQLFNTFVKGKKELDIIAIDSRKELQEKLKNKPSGGIIFSTIQKFAPETDTSTLPILSDRSNIIILVDEAHRSQYGFSAKFRKEDGKITYGYAKYLRDALPNACFIGFTGTPIELEDKDTRAVFGEYIDIYDIEDAVKDKVTVPIYYEARQIPIRAKNGSLTEVDKQIEEIAENMEDPDKNKIKFTAVEALVDSQNRIEILAKDLVEHFENRRASIDGKGMIVCMSRKICVHLYDEIIKIRPQWHSDNYETGAIKIIMTGSAADPEKMQKHIYNRQAKEEIERRFKDINDPLKLVIVCDMWLAGFDAPPLHTMYIDKPMRGHTLIQAISRVNRVFKDKDTGLIVDYIGIVKSLEEAVSNYTQNGGEGRIITDVAIAFDLFLKELEKCRDCLKGFEYSNFRTESFHLMPDAVDFILGKHGARESFCDACLKASKAYGLCKNKKEAVQYNDELAFFQYIRAVLIKRDINSGKVSDKNAAEIIKTIIDNSIIVDGVVDIFKNLGIDNPDLSIISDEFLDKIENIPQKNLAVELLQKLIKDKIKTKFSFNIAAQQKFSLKLQEAITKYNNGTIEAAQVIEEIISIAKETNEADKKGAELGLSEKEKAFYDAIEQNEDSVRKLGNDTLKKIVFDIMDVLRTSTKVDWAQRESVRAQIKLLIKKVLRKYSYPDDFQEAALEMVLKQAEILADNFAA